MRLHSPWTDKQHCKTFTFYKQITDRSLKFKSILYRAAISWTRYEEVEEWEDILRLVQLIYL